MSPFVWVILIWVLNYAISWFNAWGAGKAWAEAKAAGGWPRFMTWVAAIMSVIGFTWCYLLLEVGGLYYIGFLDQEMALLTIKLGYVVLAPVLVGLGFTVVADSWARAFRNGGVVNYGVAVYNTYAQYRNTMGLINSFGGAFKDVGDGLFGGNGKGGSSKSSKDGAQAIVIIGLALLALILGILHTVLVLKKAAGTSELRDFDELRAAKGRR